MDETRNPYIEGTWEPRFVYNKRTGKVRLHRCLIFDGEIFHVGAEARLDKETFADDIRIAALYEVKEN